MLARHGPRVPRRLRTSLGSLLLLTLVGAILAPTALGATVRRTWRAALGGGGASGSAVLIIDTNATGSVQITMRGLSTVRTYSLTVYVGTCSKPRVVAVLPTVSTSTTGAISRTIAIRNRQGAALWSTASSSTIAIRLASGSETHCGILTHAVATRVVIAPYGIDLPIVAEKGDAYPLCNVALYFPALSQPGEAGPMFVFAHARTGMFLPLLTASKVNNGNAMIGMTIKIWTTDSKLWTYVVTRVLRHQYTLPAYDPNVGKLWIQTSEGPNGTPNKLIIEAMRRSSATASFADSHPVPHPIVCH